MTTILPLSVAVPVVAEAALAAAPVPSPTIVVPASVAPAGWAPATLTYTPGARRSGMAPGVFDALRGVTEGGNGQPLTDAQVATLAPFLANAYALPAPVVEHDLRDTRIYMGGPAAAQPNWAVTLGHDIYVGRPDDVQHITSWNGRHWLAHELGHTMQWRQAGGGDNDVSHTRHFLASYGAAMPAAVGVGAYRWLRGKLDHDPGGPSFNGAMHDAHRMEVEAERHAREFLAAHPA
ncbi:MAG: DUF4157 domain-containing protein [Thermoleophilia bacterium]|nr:DUF4157 domain-containing protein [Thermoleophilia bacterium]